LSYTLSQLTGTRSIVNNDCIVFIAKGIIQVNSNLATMILHMRATPQVVSPSI